MTSADFIVYNMPQMLGREVRKQDPADSASRWVRDESWYESTRQRFFYLFKFFQDNHLVTKELVTDLRSVENAVLWFSALSDEGQSFVKMRFDERWLKSFDRPGTQKKSSDVSYLQKQLQQIRSKT
jgi:hypothetical protein